MLLIPKSTYYEILLCKIFLKLVRSMTVGNSAMPMVTGSIIVWMVGMVFRVRVSLFINTIEGNERTFFQ